MTATATAPAPAPSSTGTTQAIPFRPEARSVAGSAVDALLVLSLLLVGCLALVWFAKKRGWLERWVVSAPSQSPSQALRVVQMLRLSPKTTLYRVSDEQGQYLVIESNLSVQVMPTPLQGDRDHA